MGKSRPSALEPHFLAVAIDYLVSNRPLWPVDVAIGKPLFDTMTPDGPCRPDFVLEGRSRVTGELRTIVVEAMGFDTDEYHAAKAITHPRMRHMGELLSLTPADIEDDIAPARIAAALAL